MPEDLSPMLHQQIDNAPALGGDHKIELCPVHGDRMVRDMFKAAVCLTCVEHDRQLDELRRNPVCPHCGSTEYLSVELDTGDVAENPANIRDFIGVFCDGCSNYVWIDDGPYRDYTCQAYLAPNYQLTDWF